MKKVYFLDTCVLLHEPSSIYSMGSNDIYLCMEVLNELDRIKDSSRTVAYEARQVIRTISSLINDKEISEIRSGVSLGEGLGSLVILPDQVEDGLSGDDAIMRVVKSFQDQNPDKETVLVTRDVNMGIRSKMFGVRKVQDYRSDRISSTEVLDDTGVLEFEVPLWDLFGNVESSERGDFRCQLHDKFKVNEFILNRYVVCPEGKIFKVRSIDEHNGYVELTHVRYTKLYGLEPKNDRQNMAFDAVKDESINLVSLTGSAGCGKTLIALAGALELVLETEKYNRIVIVRNTPPIAEESGFLPGDETEKMLPYMQGALDALSYLCNDAGAREMEESVNYIVESANISFKSVNTMRGASVSNTVLIIEESQNLSRTAIKALVTRVAEGSKVILTGNLNSSQIDSSYVTPYTSGLARVIDVFEGHEEAAHVQLQGGQRGGVASHAEEFL
ncbi:PhoH family protein [Vibrio barjaei]|uniref:PhoH family protein n=1 Tax=Vibrio barjaei TaxID=1676683 RepID=UPI002283DC55|nr:PhoH family protein [Vibrio barjaei]MCY9872331.1 PhoH family protein [Vibrio barjaei]